MWSGSYGRCLFTISQQHSCRTPPDFEAAGMEPFRPYGDGRAMQYYEVPIAVLEDVDALRNWAAKAVEVAQRARKRKRR